MNNEINNKQLIAQKLIAHSSRLTDSQTQKLKTKNLKNNTMNNLQTPLRLQRNWKNKAFVREQSEPVRFRSPRF